MDFTMPQFNISDPNSQFGNTLNGYGSLQGYGGGTQTGSPLIGSGANTLGLNIPTFQLGLGGLQSLAGLYTGLKSLNLAKDSFNLQKTMAQKNLANSTASYNTALSDRASSRGVAEGQTSQQVQDYINANKLTA